MSTRRRTMLRFGPLRRTVRRSRQSRTVTWTGALFGTRWRTSRRVRRSR
ncbi:hypothetical protein H7X46_10680 [Pseudonocardia sp. C8]|nr:hypothetical protein [Pseudonocardia sp. C8]MBC3191527.1 hypothetical protein [Pseudonocardia sp. C8]